MYLVSINHTKSLEFSTTTIGFLGSCLKMMGYLEETHTTPVVLYFYQAPRGDNLHKGEEAKQRVGGESSGEAPDRPEWAMQFPN